MKRVTLGATAVLAASMLTNPIAQAATGPGHLEDNPGIIALTDGQGNQVCSAVMVSQQWALTFEGPMTCGGAEAATADSHDRVEIDSREFPDMGGPGKSQAMLVHFAQPVQRVHPARFDLTPPESGEALTVAAYNGSEGVNHLLSIGESGITVEGHREWLSWYGKPETLQLETGKDSGAPIMRDGRVVAFTGLVTEASVDAEDVANVADWVHGVTGVDLGA